MKSFLLIPNIKNQCLKCKIHGKMRASSLPGFEEVKNTIATG